jgi:hypothetical protein
MIAVVLPAIVAIWLVKMWKYDIPKKNRDTLIGAVLEKRELAKHLASQKRGDRLLESMVADGAPRCILSLRRISSESVEGGDLPMNPTQTLQSYLQFHQAMKLYGDE